ncbi:MAG: phosphoribosylamine--glycine ligase [Alphaproteobacteria bacterium]|nr:phosphoribosylamine--glycine ligase [Alphaproteobacteria bacterium]
MKVLVVGSGGREHTLCWSFKRSPLCEKLYCSPGNAGISELAECLPFAVNQTDEITEACKRLAIDFVMVGPEEPLTLGLADKIRAAGIPCFGPSKEAARLEGSKGYMKDLFARAGVPTAAYKRFNNPEEAKNYVRSIGAPIVIKADGLAAGKGVTVARTIDEANNAIDDAMVKLIFGNSGKEIVVEEFLEGEEVSFFAISDGKTAVPFAAAQDHKTAYDGDKGPNTGGMGAYSPVPAFNMEMQEQVMREMIIPTVNTMRTDGTPFTGILFAGLMLTAKGPKILEYNVRFGDPETQAMLPRLKSDLLEVLYAASKGELGNAKLDWHDRAALCVVMASNGYPGEYKKGSVIKDLDKAASIANSFTFHAGTRKDGNGNTTSYGGRVLGVTGWGSTIADARASAYKAVDSIDWKEGFCRRDIGWRAVK